MTWSVQALATLSSTGPIIVPSTYSTKFRHCPNFKLILFQYVTFSTSMTIIDCQFKSFKTTSLLPLRKELAPTPIVDNVKPSRRNSVSSQNTHFINIFFITAFI
ncbi:hypothetical protein QL285_068189 [Trifolium repens]|nr:hypothetical protein QL285_068189 [Trifolium repens]